jgi:hypothetical protein
MTTKLILTVFLASCAVFQIARAQDNAANLLVKHTWAIDEDMMSGLGTHQSLPAGAQITFSADGNWQSTQPIFNATSGTWQLKGNDNLLMQFGSKAKKSKGKILKISDKELSFKIKRRSTAHTYTWHAK